MFGTRFLSCFKRYLILGVIKIIFACLLKSSAELLQGKYFSHEICIDLLRVLKISIRC